MKKNKKGRGALVRRLRREYGITEHDARVAAGGAWGVDDPDLTAARMRDDNRSRMRELRQHHASEGFADFRGRGVCPDLFLDWGRPDDSRPPTWPSRRGTGGGRGRLRSLGMAAMVLSLGGGR